MSDKRNPTPPRSGNGGTPATCATVTCDPPCQNANIIKPKGSHDSSSNPTNSWLTTSCFHFDFQGVVSSSAGAYVLQFEGSINPSPPYTPKWTLDSAAGTLSNDTTTSPTHTAPNTEGEGELELTGMKGATAASCTDNKQIKIYKDHLARDKDNFGTGISCGANGSAPWSFTYRGATINMANAWNCHGGTRHIYNGSGNGNTGPSGVGFLLNSTRLKKTVTVTHTPTGGGSHPPLGTLDRGDIVAYYTGGGDLAHTQTCTGVGTETYGANNVPVSFPGRPRQDEAWEWATSTAGDWANNIKTNLFTGATPFTIKVFSKP